MPHWGWAALLAANLQFSGPAAAQSPAPDDGVRIGNASLVRKLVPAAQLESAAGRQFSELKRDAAAQKKLLPIEHPQSRQLRRIANTLIPFTGKFNDRAKHWRWEVILIESPQINAFCMPGGKIAFYTGILDKLKLTEDEIAMVMGHEMAHALREHARERIAKTGLTRTGAALMAELLGVGDLGRLAIDAGSNLLTLRFSRDDESESDLVGLELGARGGFDPRAGVSLWKKMSAASKGAPPQWLSTHPSGTSRIQEIERHLPEVMPIYHAHRKPRDQSGRPPPAPEQTR